MRRYRLRATTLGVDQGSPGQLRFGYLPALSLAYWMLLRMPPGSYRSNGTESAFNEILRITTLVPEPGSVVLLGTAFCGMLLALRLGEKYR
jgi:hypothetical protein